MIEDRGRSPQPIKDCHIIYGGRGWREGEGEGVGVGEGVVLLIVIFDPIILFSKTWGRVWVGEGDWWG